MLTYAWGLSLALVISRGYFEVHYNRGSVIHAILTHFANKPNISLDFTYGCPRALVYYYSQSFALSRVRSIKLLFFVEKNCIVIDYLVVSFVKNLIILSLRFVSFKSTERISSTPVRAIHTLVTYHASKITF